MLNVRSKSSAEILVETKSIAKREAKEAGSFHYAVAVNRWSMRLLGLWPLDSKFSNLRCSVSFMLIFALCSPGMIHLLTMTDWEATINQANFVFAQMQFLMRFIFIKINTENLRIVTHSMIIDWTNYRYLPKEERRSMMYFAKRGRLLNMISIIGVTLSFTVYLLTPLLNTWMHDLPWNATTKNLPTEGYYPFPSKQSPVFEMLYVAQSLIAFLCGTVIFSVDGFFCNIVFHACGQMDILAMMLKRYHSTIQHTSRKYQSSINCVCLPCIVRRHVHIISYMDIVRRSFSKFMLFILITILFILTLQGYEIVMNARDSNISSFVTFALYGLTSTYTIFIYCYVGECIIEKSENIGKIAYNLKWYHFPRKYALPIILLIMRSRVFCKIVAGRFTTMCFSCYTNILMTSISYISVLMAVNK